MILDLSTKYQKASASLLLTVFYTSFLFTNTYALRSANKHEITHYSLVKRGNTILELNNEKDAETKNIRVLSNTLTTNNKVNKTDALEPVNTKKILTLAPNIGGPSQPEMASFKSVGTGNMVNLFTGDFSYNIPLMDVGGYPVNIFYDGGVGMEQEASWVGLGWNINPGNVNRNVRGVPDDFDGTEMLKQTQVMKPNKTWGVNLGVDLELIGEKNIGFSVSKGYSLGVSVNNYLGPALELGASVNFSADIIPTKTGSEKSSLSAGVGLGANLSSRDGLTISPYASLSGMASLNDKGGSTGASLGLTTSYNSRSGIKGIQLQEQMSFNKGTEKKTSTRLEFSAANHNTMTASTTSNVISFLKPTYTPTMRMKITNSAYAGRFQLGGAIFGVYASAQLQGFSQTSEVAENDKSTSKPMYGYLNYQNAKIDPDAVMDFTRFNDQEVMPSTPIISTPQYAYDVFSVQAEGTGGSIRLYRNDLGYVRDNLITTKDKSLSAGIDIGIPGHVGGNFSVIKTPSSIGEWKENNYLRSMPGFQKNAGSNENVYFRNPGETSVINPHQFDQIGGLDLVRFKLGDSKKNPALTPILERFSKGLAPLGETSLLATSAVQERKKRTQVISFLTAKEATEVGLDHVIKNYDAVNILSGQNGDWKLNYTSLDRFDNLNKKQNHISQINVTESNGKRYIYGVPVYNLRQNDFTFSVSKSGSPDDDNVLFSDLNDVTKNSQYLSPNSSNKKDGYFLETETPAYAHSFLLSGILSSDYVDVGGDGITEDDLGGAIKFNYTKINETSKWRTPLSTGMEANFNAGKRSDIKDDKGIISYGERESWYVHSIESKSMIAIFTLENRDDGKGAISYLGGINGQDNSKRRLKKIDLYNKSDLKANGIGLTGAKPVKTVWFDYDYSLCKGTKDNTNSVEAGKLTLKGIHFTYNGKRENSSIKNKYEFAYQYNITDDPSENVDNPHYEMNASDRWGTYKKNDPVLRNKDFPYTMQDKTIADQNAGAWALKKILLPSGGQMEINYESDDYAYVQNKRAAVMMKVLGFTNNLSNARSSKLYKITPLGVKENSYVYIHVPVACSTKQEVFDKYLNGIQQLAFKLAVKMPKGDEYVNSYATIDGDNYGIDQTDGTYQTIWIKLNNVDRFSPLSLTAIEFLREQLPGQAYKGYDVSESSGLKQQFEMLLGLMDGLVSAAKDPIDFLRLGGLAQETDISKCLVRLNCPDGFKYGGGSRVKSVILKDNWRDMSKQAQSNSNPKSKFGQYGQLYDYSTTELVNGIERTISSGVASYEPTFGSDENPFQTMYQFSDKAPLGPATYGAVELPVLDAFYPSPVVGYSKVTVRSIKKQPTDQTKKLKSGIGKQVTTFYTAKDFPVYSNYTRLDDHSKKEDHSSVGAFFYSYSFDTKAISQGFVIETNDMHGKMKSEASYAENDDKTPVNYTENFYKNTGEKGIKEKFDFVSAADGGTITEGNMGIDVELMTDTRQFSQKTNSLEVQGQIDLFPVVFPIWFPFIWPVVAKGEKNYRAVTTTKVVSYHSVLDRVLVIDKGSQVSTENLLYDAETGQVVVTKTNNEFKQAIYNTSYPAYWAYSGMGLAYKNIDASYTASFRDGVISGVPTTAFESGDELYLTKAGDPSTDPCAASFNNLTATKLWVFDTDKDNDTRALTNEAPKFVFMDEKGRLYSRINVEFRIIRSGKRNMLDAKVANVVSMSSPVVVINPTEPEEDQVRKLKIDNTDNINKKVVNVSAIEYKEKWQTDNDVFKRYRLVHDAQNCTDVEVEDCTGYLEKQINPYVKGLIGNFKPCQNFVFYDKRVESDPLQPTNLSKNGFLENFKLYWDFNSANNLIPDFTNTIQWVTSSNVTKFNARGLELETKDALDIYTAAQYGFNKTVPVAIANNSRSSEMLNDGFEDFNYDEGLNETTSGLRCYKSQSGITEAFENNIVEATSFNFAAHTGKKVLKLNNGAVPLEKSFSVTNQIFDDYSLTIDSKTVKSLVDPGINTANFLSNPANGGFNIVHTNNGGFRILTNIGYNYDAPSNSYSNSFSYEVTHYFEIVQKGIYTLSLETLNDVATSDPQLVSAYSAINDLNGNYIGSLASNQFGGDVKQICLNPGIYKVNSGLYSTFNSGPISIGSSGGSIDHIFTISINSTSYKSVTSVNNCVYKVPVYGTESMFNSNYLPSPNKKMLFTSWVKRDCIAPCNQGIYMENKVELDFGSGQLMTMEPQGPIIEGWQKVEGDFIIPANSSSLTVRIINNGTTPSYWDDIRIHPYNANMKSYVYDPISMRLTAELDANNYATFYEYDEEGTLIRTKVETKEGIKTLTESRSAIQKTAVIK
ncbi:MAG: autotransporter outer membrane beta-barrel domain-containing protein [Ferruginibacter sp.]